MTHTLIFDGHILGASFASGDRFVAGRWFASPFGAFADLMWCRPDGTRLLIAPRPEVRDFVARHYAFEELILDDVRVERTGAKVVEVRAGTVTLRFDIGPRGIESRLLGLRPPWLRTMPAWIAIEDSVLRPIVSSRFAAGDVRARGTTRSGARECYGIHDFRPAQVSATLEGIDLGSVAACPPAGFGFSEFPSRPALVRVTSRFATRA